MGFMQKNSAPGWLSIELRHLAALQAVAEERSFVRAAERLGYTQSAISHQIAALERLVSERLIERARGGGPVTLTDAGHALYEHALVLISRLHAARSDVSTSRQGAGRRIRVGTSQSVAVSVLPRILQSFASEFPCSQLDLVVEHGKWQLQEAVAEGKLDVAFVSGPPALGTLGSSHLFDDQFVLLADCESERFGAHGFDLRPVVTHDPCPAQRWHESALQGRSDAPKGRLTRVKDAMTIQALVGVGWAYGLLPALSVTNPDLYQQVLAGPKREVHLVWQQDRSPIDAFDRFIEIAEQAFVNVRERDGLACAIQ